VAQTAEVLVAGVGGCGASALYQLARRGVRAIGIDRFEPGHDRGSSHGDTRVIRQAYFEHPDYVPLLRRAYDLWKEIEQDGDTRLLELCGLLLLGPPDGEILGGARLAAERHGAALEALERGEVALRFPAFEVPEGFDTAWEPQGGYLRVEECVRTYARRAVQLGAELRTGESIRGWRADARGVRVETDHEVYEAERLVLCPGAWAPALLPGVAPRAGLRVLRKVLLWYPRRSAQRAVPETTFFAELPYGGFYGFPCLDGRTVKLAEHTGGDEVDDPLRLDRELYAVDSAGPERFIAEVLPTLAPQPVHHAVCMYTMTSDAHFVVDRHPEHGNVVLAAGFSGHGFKFMSALGAILCELALDGHTPSPIDFLSLARFAADA
jgi:sarcosine oxidase